MVSTGNTSVKLSQHRHLIAYLLLLVSNLLLFSLSAPLESPVVVVIGGFLVAAADLTVVTYLLVRFLCVVMPKLKAVQRRLTVALASFGVVSLALASLGQLTGRDAVVVVVIWTVGYLYSLRFSLNTNNTT